MCANSSNDIRVEVIHTAITDHTRQVCVAAVPVARIKISNNIENKNFNNMAIKELLGTMCMGLKTRMLETT